MKTDYFRYAVNLLRTAAIIAAGGKKHDEKRRRTYNSGGGLRSSCPYDGSGNRYFDSDVN
jgi:hypothetical protein